MKLDVACCAKISSAMVSSWFRYLNCDDYCTDCTMFPHKKNWEAEQKEKITMVLQSWFLHHSDCFLADRHSTESSEIPQKHGEPRSETPNVHRTKESEGFGKITVGKLPELLACSTQKHSTLALQGWYFRRSFRSSEKSISPLPSTSTLSFPRLASTLA